LTLLLASLPGVDEKLVQTAVVLVVQHQAAANLAKSKPVWREESDWTLLREICLTGLSAKLPLPKFCCDSKSAKSPKPGWSANACGGPNFAAHQSFVGD